MMADGLMPVSKFTVQPWLRVLKLIIDVNGKSYPIQSDGTKNGLKIDCEIHRSNMSLAAPSTFSIFNLAAATREGIKQGGNVELLAGWENFAFQTVYKGSIRAVLNMRRGGDILTEVSTQPLDFKSNYDHGQWNFAPKTEVKTAALTLARAITGAVVAEEDFKDIKGQIGEGGWSATGNPKTALTKLGEQYKFNAWGDDGKVRVKDVQADKSGAGTTIYEISGDGGALIDINPIYIGPYKNGIKQVAIKALFIPGIVPGKVVAVKSTLNPRFNKDWRVASMDTSLCAYDDKWTMTLTCWN
jgi:hypothetical protein